MIGLVDIGNTRTKCGVVSPDGKWQNRVFPRASGIPAEAKEFLSGLTKVVIASVVPSETPAWAQALINQAGLVHVAGHDSPWGFKVAVESPTSLGVDRLANLEGALSFTGTVLVVDAGTATKFDLLEGMGQRTFPGGAIAPGMQLGYEALIAGTAQLPRIELNKHSPVVGYNTETAIRSGVVHGFAALVDGMVLRIFEERGLPPSTSVVATGGNSSYLQGRARFISTIRPHLTLEGLHGLAQKL